MPDILFDFPVLVPAEQLFDAVSTPAGLDRWWTESSSGIPAEGESFDLGFGPGYEWRATVERAYRPLRFDLELTVAMPDWVGTRVCFEIEPTGEDRSTLRFAHRGWAAETEHHRVSSFCWALYLRLLRRAVERGEVVPYALRLDA
jgi:uncharacterized protein YndB with AHSA1/START domain